MIARCSMGCPNKATFQAVFRRSDGTHFLSTPVCDEHRNTVPIGPLRFTPDTEIVDYMEVAS